MKVPSLLLRQLYTFGSLTAENGGVAFKLKNRLSDARLVAIEAVTLDGREVPLERVTLSLDDGARLRATEIGADTPVPFALRQVVTVHVAEERLDHGNGFRMHIEAANPETGSTDIVRSVRAMNSDIESIITRFPEQYLWFYKRYRRRPEGCERMIYKKGAWRSRHSALPER